MSQSESVTSSEMPAASSGVARITMGLWVALAAAVVQLSSIASDFYQVGDEVRDAWFGVPHTADLILISALTTVVLIGFLAAGRSPVRGRTIGWLIAGVGLIATLQVAYRMAVPPFGGCLTYTCLGTPKNPDVSLLVGMWIALGGCVVATIGGLMHAFSARARDIVATFWVADEQTGMTSWLAIGTASLVGAFVLGFTILDFYAVPGDNGMVTWSAWLSIPHTSTLVLILAVVAVLFTLAAAKRRSPLMPSALGALVAVFGFVIAARTAYRMLVPPFYSGPAAGVFQEGAQILAPAFLGLALGVVAIVAGILYARSGEAVTSTQASTRPVAS